MDCSLGADNMRYFKDIEGGYIIAIGTGGNGVEITEDGYDEIMTVVQNKPPRTEDKDYRLKPDLTWEEYDRPPDPEPEVEGEELLNILLGGE